MAPKSIREPPAWLHYETALSAIRDRILDGDIPPPDLLAQALEGNKDKQLPTWFVSVISAQLRGTLKRKRGRKRSGTEWHVIFIELVDWDYRRHHDWLAKLKSSQGLKGWKCVQGQSWWSGPPHERALAMVHELYSRKHKEFCGGSGCLNSISASISGAAAGVRLPRGRAAC